MRRTICVIPGFSLRDEGGGGSDSTNADVRFSLTLACDAVAGLGTTAVNKSE
jgi:hypothetical protein